MEEKEKIPLHKDWTGKSSQILFTSYNPITKQLSIRFNTNAKYIYENVPLEVWNKLYNTDSVGKFVNQEIKGKYTYKKVD